LLTRKFVMKFCRVDQKDAFVLPKKTNVVSCLDER
jgi:hypothetical protein